MTTILLTAGQLIIGPASTTITDGAVLLEAGRVAKVGPRAEVTRSLEGTRVDQHHDFPESSVLPGLIDSHVHLAFDCSDDPAGMLAATPADQLYAAMSERASQLLTAGVTTARDLGDLGRLTIRLRDAIAAGTTPGPRLLAATTPLTPPRGHCWFLGGEVNSLAEAEALIAENAASGADLIKVMASGGAMTPGGPPMWADQFSAEDLAAIVQHAAGHGLPVAAHAHGTTAIADCATAGVSTIEHCSWRTEKELVYDEATAQTIADRGITVCRCISADWRDFLERLGPNAQPLMDSIKKMRAAGIRFTAGTDAGVPGSAFTDYAGMLEFFSAVGFTNAEILDMATVNAAQALGLGSLTGTLTPGSAADVIVVDGDPLMDLSALRGPRLVLAAGRELPLA